MNLAILASHNGSAFDYILESKQQNLLPNINLALVITNNSNANIINKANKANIPCIVINSKLYPDINLDEKIKDTLLQYKVDFVLLAGYMKKIGNEIVDSFPNKIINSHPALLPKYGGVGMYGRFVHEAVLANKEKSSGVTIHFVNNHYDEGEIILQKSINIDSSWNEDKLEYNIKLLEKEAIIEVLGNLK
jgi:phosphoribosylglycinamide formyltransferase 1